ncbi:hypothetical protein C8N46_103173 [Kordia periserrulae]|uniref:Heme-binding HmuY-like protein n=1 Tax=Kordia periserrulae TaxID=701523 RepID=A0A2T6C192_9FLAO|nr:hypothetical protein [Kordia periserrulae]PTX62075.1 hypothetical protein C8N46_103173 [Kordia periserrulae]
MKKILILATLALVISSCSKDENNDFEETVNQEFTGKDMFYLDGKLQSVSFEDADPNTYELVIQGDQRIDAFSSVEELAKSNFDKKIHDQFLTVTSSTPPSTVNKYKTIEELESSFVDKAPVISKSATDPHGIFDHPLGIQNHSNELVFHYVRADISWMNIPLRTSSNAYLDIYAVYQSTGLKNFYNQATSYLFRRSFTIKNHSNNTKYLYLRRASDNTWFFQQFTPGLEVSNLVNFDVSQIYVF